MAEERNVDHRGRNSLVKPGSGQGVGDELSQRT